MKKSFKFFIIPLIIFMSILLVACGNMGGKSPFGSLQKLYQEAPDMTPRLIEATQPTSAVEVSKNVSPAVVGIVSTLNNSYSVGSGVAVAKGGYILTNNHVIENPKNIRLYLADGTNISADFVWGDKTLDLAILKSSKDLPYLKIIQDTNTSVGETVLAIGTPLQLQFKHSVTKGIVSALNRTVKFDSDGKDAYLQSLIQHDASINPGNSGGPLINLKGQVVGINTLKIALAEGIGFAIPTSVVQHVINSVVKTGTYQAAYLGVFGYDANIAYLYKKSTSQEGFYVLSVQKDSPADKAGIKEGDVILSINDKKINSLIEFQTHFFGYKQKDTLNIEFKRLDKVKNLKVTLQARPDIKLTKQT